MKRSKAYRAATDKIEAGKVYSPLEAIRLAKDTSTTKYDSTVEVAMRLGVDPRKADQMVRGTVNLPHGTGKTARVLVFANGDKAEAAREASRAVWERADAEPALEGMGTTLTAVAVLGDAEQAQLAVVSVGDSRAYLFRDGLEPAHP